MVFKKVSKLLLSIVVALSICLNSVEAKKVVEDGDTVEVKYTGYLDDDRIFDSNNFEEDKTLKFIVGSGAVLEDFNNSILGLSKKEETTVFIPAAKAYGEVDKNKIIKLNTKQLPKDSEPGKRLELRSLNRTIPVRLVEVDGDTAYVDANHLLSGKSLKFDIKVIKISKADD
ncbi:MAG: FKBP-type peptidyl-prolyl cis-trans isomerase [Candidatus Caenarcaniphilales bacterium]|nr:FKBP-type peptidyl-prolyl cis-trans isomerase [Candidatus Caenarcaniphilales bacterium]